MPRGQGKPRRLYTCAEDLCDPYEAEREGTPADAGVPKARAHAVRLMDAMAGEATPPTRPSLRSESGVGSLNELQRDELPTQARPRARLAAERHAAADRDGQDLGGDTGYAILSVKPSGEGETVAVVLAVPADAAAEAANGATAVASPCTDGACIRVRLYLLVEQYADLRPREGSIAPERADELLQAGRLCAAVKRGMRLLAYGDQSARRLSYKLTARGIDRATADAATAYLAEKGYIHEDDTASLRAEADVRKLWGPRRIREDLRANGFTSEAIADAMEALADVDFEENCVILIRKKYRVLPQDRGERQKIYAALARMGYDSGVIREALSRAERACSD